MHLAVDFEQTLETRLGADLGRLGFFMAEDDMDQLQLNASIMSE